MPTHQPLQSEYDVIIVGAGASGLMCAITAGQRGRSVLVLDHANKIGKKILISGGGRCNFTNQLTEPANYLSLNPHFCKSALARYTPWNFQALVDKHLIPWHEKTLGQLFCDNRSQDIVDMLVEECRNANTTIRLKTFIDKIEYKNEAFFLATSTGIIKTTSVVIATGGLSFPTMGATGFGYEIAKQFGHNIISCKPALVPFTLPEVWLQHFSKLAGTSAMVSVHCNNKRFRENILFTHKGLSGPAILQISSYWQPGDTVSINWLPDSDILTWLKNTQKKHPKAEFSSVLAYALAKRLARTLCTDAMLAAHSDNGLKRMQDFSPKHLAIIASLLENWLITPSGTEGYKKAEVTLGGVDTQEISSKTFESNKQPGLFFIGEVLDVTGHLGGFNFQWAWASGHCAGQHV